MQFGQVSYVFIDSSNYIRLLFNISYNGSSIGSASLDRMQRITGSFSTRGLGENRYALFAASSGVFVIGNDDEYPTSLSTIQDTNNFILPAKAMFDSNLSPNARTGNETAPAWLASLFCITY
jgi:hypothetical protein